MTDKKVFEVQVFFKNEHRKYTICAKDDNEAVTYIQRRLSPEEPWRVFQESVKEITDYPEGLRGMVWTAK